MDEVVMLDAHCHLDQLSNPLAVAQDCEKKGITTIGVTNLPSHYVEGLEHLRRFRKVHLALGLHPLLVVKHRDELADFVRLVPHVSFIGEIGLDFSREGIATRTEQIEVFEVIASTLEGDRKFVSLHSRQAEETVLSILSAHKVEKAVFHWYSGSLTVLAKAVEQGFYFSVNPAMVRSLKGQRIASIIPNDRILTETDAPYVRVSNRPAHPSDVAIVIEYLAEEWRISAKEVAAKVLENFRRIIEDARSSQ